MPPTARKRAAKSANGKPAGTTDLDKLRAEVSAETPDAEPTTIPVPFCGTTVGVLDFWDWPAEANESLARGLIVRWASQVMPAKDFATWAGVKPTNRQAAEFIAAVEVAVGFPLGSWLTSLAS